MKGLSPVTALLWALQAASALAADLAADYTGGDTSGCGKAHWFNGITQYRSLTSTGTSRSYGIHLPSDYDKDRQYPTVVGFHGSSSIGFFFAADTRLSGSEYSADKIMVYPNGRGGAWAGANYSEATVAEDLQFVWDLLADVRANFCVDSARIYATGMSIGGGFVNTIACNDTVGGEFAAFAPASGSFYTDNDEHHEECTPAREVTPIVEIHGGADADVKYEGGDGQGGQNPGIADWIARWAKRNQCDEPPQQEDLHDGKVHHSSWTCKGQAGAVQHYKNDDQKHCWASTSINFSQLAAGDVPTYIEASRIFLDFLLGFTRPAE